MDANGRRAGEEGFLPPHQQSGLAAGAYDEHYRDENGRHVGEEGFVPPTADSHSLHTAEYDENYRDASAQRPATPFSFRLCFFFVSFCCFVLYPLPCRLLFLNCFLKVAVENVGDILLFIFICACRCEKAEYFHRTHRR